MVEMSSRTLNREANVMAKCIPMSIASDCCRLSMPRRQPDIPDFGSVAAGTRSVFMKGHVWLP